jgi:hypothetical protein
MWKIMASVMLTWSRWCLCVGSGRDVAIVWVCGQDGYRYDLPCWRDAAIEWLRSCFVVWPENFVLGQCCWHFCKIKKRI